MTDDTITKKHVLKPGRHQFAPGSAAVHCNENLSDEEAEWYLQRYPHIVTLFITLPRKDEAIKPEISKQPKKAYKTMQNDISDQGGAV